MKLRVQFYAQLRDVTKRSEMDVNLPDGSTVGQLLEQLYADMPGLASHDKSILVGAGLEFVERNYVIRPDEEISIMPPVQGG